MNWAFQRSRNLVRIIISIKQWKLMAFHFIFSFLGYNKPEFFVPDPDWWWEKRWFVFWICGFGVKKLCALWNWYSGTKHTAMTKWRATNFAKTFDANFSNQFVVGWKRILTLAHKILLTLKHFYKQIQTKLIHNYINQ